MLGRFYFAGLGVIPHNVLISVRKETKKGAVAGIRDELQGMASRRSDPNPAAKGAKRREILTFPQCNGIW